jgi:cell division protease FtsH
MEKNYSEKVAEEIDNEIKRLIDEAFEKAKKLIINKKRLLDKIAKRLIEVETIEKEEFEQMLKAEGSKHVKKAKA